VQSTCRDTVDHFVEHWFGLLVDAEEREQFRIRNLHQAQRNDQRPSSATPRAAPLGGVLRDRLPDCGLTRLVLGLLCVASTQLGSALSARAVGRAWCRPTSLFVSDLGDERQPDATSVRRIHAPLDEPAPDQPIYGRPRCTSPR
jgi:hypothetical protein